MPQCNVIMFPWRQSLTIKTPSLRSPPRRHLRTDVHRQRMAGGRAAAWPSIPPPPLQPTLNTSLINPFYGFIIFIYLPQCDFLPFQVLGQIPLDTSSLLLPKPSPSLPPQKQQQHHLWSTPAVNLSSATANWEYTVEQAICIFVNVCTKSKTLT